MPGIAGFIKKNRTGDEKTRLNAMRESMRHESFYTDSEYIDEEIGVYVCSIALENSFSDGMPVFSGDRNLVLFISGECYAYSDVLAELRRKGYEVNRERPDYILHLYNEYGEAFIDQLNGWFNGLILDLSGKKTILFNDRYGIRRIYYHETESCIYFSSEAKALLKILPRCRNIDYKGLGEYLSYDSVLEFRTLYKGINILMPSSMWIFKDGSVRKEKYFDPSEYENKEKLKDDEFFEQLKATFLDILPAYFYGDKIGMSLTGGLDTRLILACDDKIVKGMPCYTFGSMYNQPLDSRVAKKVAKEIGSEHETLVLDNKFLQSFPDFVKESIYITDGVADVCKADEIYMNRLARSIAPIRMTGKFGSQVIRHLSVFRERKANMELIPYDFQSYVKSGKETFSQYKHIDPLSFMLFIEIPQYWAGFTVSESSQLSIRSPYLDNRFVECLYRAPEGFSSGPERDFQWELMKEKNPKLFNMVTDKGLSGNPGSIKSKFTYLYYQTLNYIDKAYNSDNLPMSMHHKLSRLDSMFSFMKPQNAFAGYCGFRHYRLWFRTILSDYLKEVLLDTRTLNRPFFNEDYIKKVVNDHIAGKGNYLSDIRKIMTIELINRVMIEDIKD